MSEKCCGRVYDGYRHWPCSKPAKVEQDGRHYCGTHSPAAVAKREARSRAKYDARIAAVRERRLELERMEADAARYRWLRELAGAPGPNDDFEPEWADNLLADFFRGRWVHSEDLDAAIDAAMGATRYALTEAGYRAVMQRGAKLNGGVKAGEGGDASGN